MKSLTNGIKGFGFLDRHLSDQTAYQFAIIIAKHEGRWVFVRHRERQTWELPAGHVEPGETVTEAAHRELFEETGAADYELQPVVSYEGIYQGAQVTGMVFFAEIRSFQPLPPSEIAEKQCFSDIPEELTYPGVQPLMIAYYLNR